MQGLQGYIRNLVQNLKGERTKRDWGEIREGIFSSTSPDSRLGRNGGIR